MSDESRHDVTFLAFWGKARPENAMGPRWHPVAYHLLDVAAVTDAVLRCRPHVTTRIAHLLGVDARGVHALIVALAGLHDIGKFAPAFQAKAHEHWPNAVLGPYSDAFAVQRPHTEDGYVLWDDLLADRVADRLWAGGASALFALAPAVFGHHGRPVGPGSSSRSARSRFRSATDSALACADAVTALLSPTPVNADTPDDERVRLASWIISGVITVADWVGSREEWFPYCAPAVDDPALAHYWEYAQKQADIAVRAAGLVPAVPRAERPFADIAASVRGEPTPVQWWASTVTLPDGPVLVVIEEVTGAGKTEAAQMLVHRLMAGDRATGAYWAMPTMATANAMYARQADAINALYEPDGSRPAPSLVLAHGQQRLHDEFRSTVLGGENVVDATDRTGSEDELDSTVACAAFLADDRRAALLADVGAGTIDQAMLAALPSRFNTMRLLGLAEKVLVIDEAHAYDAYMSTELQELLRFQAALGGSAVVLSATLSRKQRTSIAQAWIDGTTGGGRRAFFGSGVALASSSYPLATMIAESGVQEIALDPAPWSRRDVPVRMVHALDDAINYVCDCADRGGAVAWVRNTVDDCLDAAARLRERGVDPLVFHARFAQGDRQAREREVMALFGPKASGEVRRGRVVVATQVIEQSLDLDFDAMVSDVAPIDLVIQRAGRLWRHQARTVAGRPDGIMMQMVVLSPEPASAPRPDWLGGIFSGTAHVYADAGVVWRTVQRLVKDPSTATPDRLRAMIESVYGSSEVPESLLAAAERAEGEEHAHAAAANYAVLKAPDGYDATAVAWVSDVRVPTRLSENRITIRLARAIGEEMLEPWVLADGPAWKSWALSEVSVSAYRVPLGSAPDARYMAAVARLRAGWGRYEQEIPVVVLDDDQNDAWHALVTPPDGKVRRLTYTARDGLSFRDPTAC